MKRSWAFLFYDVAMMAVLLLPLGLVASLVNGRTKASTIYSAALGVTVAVSLVVAHTSRLSLRAYWRSFLDQERS